MSIWIVENSSSPSAIGDSVAAFPALHAVAWADPIKIYFAAEKVRDLFYHPKAELLSERPSEGRLLDIQPLFRQFSHTGLSMPRAYMMGAGLTQLAQSNYTPEIHFNLDNENFPEEWDFLIAPFSASDNGTNTKVWPNKNWVAIIKELKRHKKKIGLLGTSKDSLDDFKDLCEPILDRPLLEVCKLLRGSCGIFLSVDNGMNWLAQGARPNHVLLLPKTQHPNWTGNPAQNAINMLIDAKPEQMLHAINQLTRNL